MQNETTQTPKNPGKIFLAVNALIYFALGILFLINPGGMAEGLGYKKLDNAGLTDVMATYGGMFAGVGVLLTLLWKDKKVETGLKIVFWTYAGFAFGRATASIRFGAFYELHCYWLAFELAWLLVTYNFLRKHSKRKQND